MADTAERGPRKPGRRHACGAIGAREVAPAGDHRPEELDRAAVDRYLRLLNVDARAPGLRALAQLTAAHAARVPFENVSKLYRFRREGRTGIPGIEAHLEGMERFHFGGTCYAVNYHLYRLLRTLGYAVQLCGADMRDPDAHLALVVTVQGRDYLVDAGYAAPFLLPLALDLPADQEIVHGEDRYLLRPRDEAGRSRLELHRRGARVHGYLLKPGARRIGEFDEIVARSFLPGATFMRTVLLTRHSPDGSIAIHGQILVQTEGARAVTRSLRDRDEVIEEVERCFGIPAPVTAEAMAGISAIGDPWE